MMKYVTVYRNACQTPSAEVVRVHRTERAAIEYAARQNARIASDGYMHGYYAALLDGAPSRGDDATEYELIEMLGMDE